MSSLTLAAQGGNIDELRQFLEKGANVDEADRYGRTALMEASQYGYLNIVEFLLERGADVHKTDHGGWTALLLASVNGRLEVVQALVQHGAEEEESSTSKAVRSGNTALIVAVERNKTNIVEYLLERAVSNSNNNNNNNIDRPNERGETALHRAACKGNLPMAQLLLEKGANPYQRTQNGRNALEEATHFKNTRLAGFICSFPFNVELEQKLNKVEAKHNDTKARLSSRMDEMKMRQQEAKDDLIRRLEGALEGQQKQMEEWRDALRVELTMLREDYKELARQNQKLHFRQQIIVSGFVVALVIALVVASHAGISWKRTAKKITAAGRSENPAPGSKAARRTALCSPNRGTNPSDKAYLRPVSSSSRSPTEDDGP